MRHVAPLRIPFANRCLVAIPLEWREAPLVRVCANPALPAAFDWQAERWITPACVRWHPERCLLEVCLLTPASGTVLLELPRADAPADEAHCGGE